MVGLRGLLLMLLPAAGVVWASVDASAAERAKPAAAPEMTMETFLDRLMMAESGGRDHLRNPRSTAVGPFQLIEPTYLEIVGRYFTAETEGLSLEQVLALRTDRRFARRVAEAYTRQNAGSLARAGIAPTYINVRLAYLVGPSAAIRIARVSAQTRVALILGPAVIKANPFLARMTAADIIGKVARDIGAGGDARVPVPAVAGAATVVASSDPPRDAAAVAPAASAGQVAALVAPPPAPPAKDAEKPRHAAAVVPPPSPAAAIPAPAASVRAPAPVPAPKAVSGGAAAPIVSAQCNPQRPACQRWLALARQRVAGGTPIEKSRRASR